MLFFKKQEIKLDDFATDFYKNKVLCDFIEGVNLYPTAQYAESLKNSLSKNNDYFKKVDLEKLTQEFIYLRFELFALVFTHKFINGEIVLKLSNITKSFLKEINKLDIWDGMEKYNLVIESSTQDLIFSLGKFNSIFNYNMRKDLINKNIEESKINNFENDVVVRENNRLLSEVAWSKKNIPFNFIILMCNQTGIDINQLDKNSKILLGSVILGFYNGAKELLDDVKIVL